MSDSYHRLLRRYAGYVQRAGYVEGAAVALRTRSRKMRDIIAYLATRERYTTADLMKFQESGHLADGNYRHRWLATLGRICALQAFQTEDECTHEQDLQFGLACLRIANPHLPRDNQHKQFHRLEVELLVARGELQEAAALVRTNEYLLNYYYGYLLSDLSNPTISGSIQTYASWVEGFNRPFVENDLLPIKPVNRSHKFNDLATEAPARVYGDPLVTVVMTSYQPELETFELAVKSILNQSWHNLELVVVDDASPAEYNTTLDRIQRLDPRIKLLKLTENGGTYRARNVGMSAASGELITGQDSDDWSHPQRLEEQVAYLASHPTATGVVVEAVRVDENLVRTSPGRLPERPCEVSLMTRRELALEVGGYVDARKGADSEFRLRLEYYCGRKTHAIKKPLYLTRIGHESLSRADFKPGWSHPVRRAFWNASRYWHRSASRDTLKLSEVGREPMPVPNKFRISNPATPSTFDVVYVCDWRAYSGNQRALVDAMKAHYDAGNQVGLMHLESLISPSKETTRLCSEVQALINSRVVTEVIPDEHAESRVVVIGDASLLQFSPLSGINLRADISLVVPDLPPCDGSEGSILYRPSDCNAVAEQIFGGEVLWTSSDPLIYRSLKDFEHEIRLHAELLPIAFKPDTWSNSRPKLANDMPIIGRHSENYIEMWPDSINLTKQTLPSDPALDIRILGDAKAYLRKFGKQQYPSNWLVFRDRDIRPQAFMSGIDFFIYFPDEEFDQGFSREAVEATAAGALTLLPEKFKKFHGESAIYASPQEIGNTVSAFINDKSEYLKAVAETQVELNKIIARNDHVAFLKGLVELNVETTAQHSEKHALE